MNVNEGLRRLGIVLGLLGAIAGGIAGFRVGRPAWSAFAAHRRFQSVLSSPTMVRASGAIRSYMSTPGERGASETGSGKPARSGPPRYDPASGTIVREQVATDYRDIFDSVADSFIPDGQEFQLNTAGLRSVTSDESGKVVSIVLTDGEAISDESLNSKDLYQSLLWPCAGFFVPWGALKLLVWIRTGFLQPA